MLMSKLVGERFKEKPADCSLVSHEFLIRGGYIRHVTNGVYSLMTPALKVVQNIENIVREEMNKIDGQEVLFPNIMPKELWDESGRYTSVGSEMFRFVDRADRPLVLGMTHEEPCVDAARASATSYTQYPFCMYQFQTKFRDEPRPRNGLIRLREFIMKDAYSFHTSTEDLEQYYEKVKSAYFRMYARMGLGEAVCVAGDNGMMGGKIAHEFTLLCPAGEDIIAHCSHCDYYANSEVAVSKVHPTGRQPTELKELTTTDCHTVQDVCDLCGGAPEYFAKAVIYRLQDGRHVIAFVRGDYDIEECKLQKIVQSELYEATPEFLLKMHAGSVGPIGLMRECNEYIVIFDESLREEHNLWIGANRKGVHLTGFDYARDLDYTPDFVDIRKVKVGDICSCGKGEISLSKGVEIGNIFQLGKKYTKPMNMTYLNAEGVACTPTMGCYGLGVTRCVASIIEVNHDERGPIWPYEVAPFKVHICITNTKNNDMLQAGKTLHDLFRNAGIDVLLDERKVSSGVQFADADLLGAPFRVIVGRDFANSTLDILERPVEVSSKLFDFSKVMAVRNVFEFVQNYPDKTL